jgi:hypothetical protein
MTRDQLHTLLDALPSTKTEDGWFAPPAERLLTLYAARDGVGLTVSKVEAMHIDHDMLRARTNKGETYMLSAEDLFAIALEAPSTLGRKAGFTSEH